MGCAARARPRAAATGATPGAGRTVAAKGPARPMSGRPAPGRAGSTRRRRTWRSDRSGARHTLDRRRRPARWGRSAGVVPGPRATGGSCGPLPVCQGERLPLGGVLVEPGPAGQCVNAQPGPSGASGPRGPPGGAPRNAVQRCTGPTHAQHARPQRCTAVPMSWDHADLGGLPRCAFRPRLACGTLRSGAFGSREDAPGNSGADDSPARGRAGGGWHPGRHTAHHAAPAWPSHC